MNKDNLWQPNADLNTLKVRARLYRFIRDFFSERDVLEVDTPIISPFATVDPFIESLTTTVDKQLCYLQTSPEFFLKRLLASGSGDVYWLGKAFRQGERGKKHNPEFTLLEWYRVGWDEHQLIAELENIVTLLMPDIEPEKTSYRDLYLCYLNIDPHAISLDGLKKVVKDNIAVDFELADKSTCFDLLMTHIIEPKLANKFLCVYDYPVEQAALAKLGENEQGQLIARRFEVYLQGMELANGYFELTDAAEQKKRFEDDVAYRAKHNLPVVPYDKNLVAALDFGMPACAGVALGIDRLLMILEQKSDISQVLSFTV